MDEIRYVCLCQRQFLSLNELNEHHLTCAHCVCPFSNNNSKITSCNIPKEFSQVTSEAVIEIVKKDSGNVQRENEQNIEQVATNFLGRKLPNRTKVPFLSRAIPLSTDHSYEQCTCGAVFMTKVGKRQHQARFCKNVNNKGKIKSGNVVKQFQVISIVEPVENEVVDSEDFVIENKSSIEIVEDGYLKNSSEESFVKHENDKELHVLENNDCSKAQTEKLTKQSTSVVM